MEELKVLELFGGIGAPPMALKLLGIDYKVIDYVEIDKYAVQSYNAIYNTNYKPQDIGTWNKDLEIDFLAHGSPCQAFSMAGRREGGVKGSGTTSSLLWESVRIISKLRPKYVLWENVKSVTNKKNNSVFQEYLKALEEQGYTNYYQVLNACDYLIPQHRERIFVLSILNDDGNFKFPQALPLNMKLKDILIPQEVEERYYLSERMIQYISNSNAKWTGNNGKALLNKQLASTINTGEGSRRCDASNYIIDEIEEELNIKEYVVDKVGQNSIKHTQTIHNDPNYGATIQIKEKFYRVRKLMPKEMWKLQGFPVEYFNKAQQVCSNTQLIRQAGNSIYVGALMALFGQLFNIEWKEKVSALSESMRTKKEK